jgi:general secretion pathway protein C
MPVVTGVLWCAAAASVAWWVLQFPQGAGAGTATVALQAAPPAQASAPMASPVARALGAVEAFGSAAPEATRYQLLGVIASSSGQGSALIGIDGQPPKAYRVGQSVAEGVVLQSLSAKQARLGGSVQGPALWTIQLPGSEKTP